VSVVIPLPLIRAYVVPPFGPPNMLTIPVRVTCSLCRNGAPPMTAVFCLVAPRGWERLDLCLLGIALIEN
jgi:hypothetical protein